MNTFRTLLLLLLATQPWLPPQWPWVPLHAVVHFSPLLLVFWVGLSRTQWLALLAIVVALHGPSWPEPAGQGPTLTVTTANLLAFQPDPGASVLAALAADPDVLVVQELTPTGRRELLQHVGADYPHRLERARTDAFGLGIYSRLPLEDGEVVEHAGLPVARARVAGVELLAAHPIAPVTPALTHARNENVAAIGSMAGGVAGPLLVVGDFNATPTDPSLAPLRAAGLVPAAERCGTPTLTWSPLPGPPLLKIDHQFASGGLRCARTWTTANPGSDHRPVHTTWVLPDSPSLASAR